MADEANSARAAPYRSFGLGLGGPSISELVRERAVGGRPDLVANTIIRDLPHGPWFLAVAAALPPTGRAGPPLSRTATRRRWGGCGRDGSAGGRTFATSAPTPGWTWIPARSCGPPAPDLAGTRAGMPRSRPAAAHLLAPTPPSERRPWRLQGHCAGSLPAAWRCRSAAAPPPHRRSGSTRAPARWACTPRPHTSLRLGERRRCRR